MRACFARRGDLLGGVADRGHHRDLEGDRVERATGRAAAPSATLGIWFVAEVVGGVERVDVDAVAQLAGHRRHPRQHRGHEDRRVGDGDRSRRPLRRKQREVVVLTLVVERPTAEGREDRLQRADVVAHPGPRRHVLGRVAALDVRLDLGAEPQREAAVARLGQLPRDLGRDHRAAGKRDGHRGAEPDALGDERGGRAAQVRSAARLGEPERAEAGCFGPCRPAPGSRAAGGRTPSCRGRSSAGAPRSDGA